MTDLSLSGVLAGDSPKSMKFGFLAMAELRPKSISQQELTSATVLRLINLLKMGVGCPCLGKNRLMEVLDGWAF